MPARAVVRALSGDESWSPATIKTMLHRLVQKGVLTFERDGKRYLYRSCLPREQCIQSAGTDFLKRVMGQEAAPVLVELVRAAALTPEDIEQLRRLLDEKESGL